MAIDPINVKVGRMLDQNVASAEYGLGQTRIGLRAKHSASGRAGLWTSALVLPFLGLAFSGKLKRTVRVFPLRHPEAGPDARKVSSSDNRVDTGVGSGRWKSLKKFVEGRGNPARESAVRAAAMKVIRAVDGENVRSYRNVLDVLDTSTLSRIARELARADAYRRDRLLEELGSIAREFNARPVDPESSRSLEALASEREFADLRIPVPRGGVPDPALIERPDENGRMFTDPSASLRKRIAQFAGELVFPKDVKSAAEWTNEKDVQGARIRELLKHYRYEATALAVCPLLASRCRFPMAVQVGLIQALKLDRKVALSLSRLDENFVSAPQFARAMEISEQTVENPEPKGIDAMLDGVALTAKEFPAKELSESLEKAFDWDRMPVMMVRTTKPIITGYFQGLQRLAAAAVKDGPALTPQEADYAALVSAHTRAAQKFDAEILLEVLKATGPYFKKILQALGDFASTPEMRNLLAQLKSNLEPIDAEMKQAMLLQVREASDGEISAFENIRSLGAASVGETISATARTRAHPEGQGVVIKLLRPGIEQRAVRERDLLFAITFAEAIFKPEYVPIETDPELPPSVHDQIAARHKQEWEREVEARQEAAKGEAAVRWLSVIPVLNQVDDELDLRNEARNTDAAHVYNDADETGIRAMRRMGMVAPSRSALMIERAPGKTLEAAVDELDPASPGFDPETALVAGRELADRLGRLGRLWLDEALFGSGFYHGDLHAGNMLFKRDDGSGGQGATLTMIDFGNSTTLAKMDRAAIIGMLAAAQLGHPKVLVSRFLTTLDDAARAVIQNDPDKRAKLVASAASVIGDASIEPSCRLNAVLEAFEGERVPVPGVISNFSRSQVMLANAIDRVNLFNRTNAEAVDAPPSPDISLAEIFKTLFDARKLAVFGMLQGDAIRVGRPGVTAERIAELRREAFKTDENPIDLPDVVADLAQKHVGLSPERDGENPAKSSNKRVQNDGVDARAIAKEPDSDDDDEDDESARRMSVVLREMMVARQYGVIENDR